jgi:pimeloyl-ACP methyl ester carboxylesterase
MNLPPPSRLRKSTRWLPCVCFLMSSLSVLSFPGCGGEKHRVGVDGHAMQLRPQGHGSPTVVFESGAGGLGLETWNRVQSKVARFTRTVTYDRCGCGKSEPGPEPQDARRIAVDLHTLLQRVAARPPYLMVGHSSGAFYIRMFADSYPKEVAGLVFVDPATEQIYDWFKLNVPDAVKAKVDPSRMPPGERAEWQARHLTAEQIRSTSISAHLPVVVISSIRRESNHLPGFLDALLDSHKQLVKKLPNAKHILTEESGHNIPREQPQLIVQAVQEILQEIKHPKTSTP